MNRVLRTAGGRLVQLRPVRLLGLQQSHVVHPHPRPQAPMMHSARRQSRIPQANPHPRSTEETTRQPEAQPIPSGQAYRVTSPPEHSLVTPPLAQALSRF